MLLGCEMGCRRGSRAALSPAPLVFKHHEFQVTHRTRSLKAKHLCLGRQRQGVQGKVPKPGCFFMSRSGKVPLCAEGNLCVLTAAPAAAAPCAAARWGK